jgi:hypothetical protein
MSMQLCLFVSGGGGGGHFGGPVGATPRMLGGGEWSLEPFCRKGAFRPSGGDFQGIGVYRSDGGSFCRAPRVGARGDAALVMVMKPTPPQ